MNDTLFYIWGALVLAIGLLDWILIGRIQEHEDTWEDAGRPTKFFNFGNYYYTFIFILLGGYKKREVTEDIRSLCKLQRFLLITAFLYFLFMGFLISFM